MPEAQSNTEVVFLVSAPYAEGGGECGRQYLDIHTPASIVLTSTVCSKKARPTSNYELLVRPPRRISAAKWPGLCNLSGGHEPRTARSTRATVKLMSLSLKETWEDCYTGLCRGLYASACGWEWVGRMGVGSSGDEFRTLHKASRL